MSTIREMAKRVLPTGAVDAYRRRRAVRRYLRSLGYELHDRQARLELEELEGKILARRPDITERLLKDVLERTDIVLQELDRQLEALRARHGAELRALRDDVESLRSGLRSLQASVGGPGVTAEDGGPILPSSVAD